MVAALISDLRLGLRMVRKTPGLSTAAILTIALGVGLVTQTYSTVDGSVLRGLNVPGADRLVHVNEHIPSLDRTNDQIPLRVYLDLRRQQTVFEDVAAGYESSFNLAGEGAPPERVRGDVESANALALVGVPPLMGRVFREGEDAADAPPRIVLSYRLWKNRFDSDPAVVGKTIRVNGEATEIIGVMPEGFRFPFDEDAWMTVRLDPATMSRDAWRVDVFARIRAGATTKAVSSDLEEIARWMAATYPTDAQPSTFLTEPYAERYMPRQIADVLFLMLAATFGVLLIACANVANLLLARATIRSREVAVRTALGANRVRVVRQLFSEALVLAILGGVLGAVLAWVGAVAMDRAIADIEKPHDARGQRRRGHDPGAPRFRCARRRPPEGRGPGVVVPPGEPRRGRARGGTDRLVRRAPASGGAHGEEPHQPAECRSRLRAPGRPHRARHPSPGRLPHGRRSPTVLP
jgi:putative ABC transport system permease protein